MFIFIQTKNFFLKKVNVSYQCPTRNGISSCRHPVIPVFIHEDLHWFRWILLELPVRYCTVKWVDFCKFLYFMQMYVVCGSPRIPNPRNCFVLYTSLVVESLEKGRNILSLFCFLIFYVFIVHVREPQTTWFF